MSGISVTMVLHDAETDRPEHSMEGVFVCSKRSGMWFVVPYSKKHDAFNVRDYTPDYDVANMEISAEFWAEPPESPEADE